MKIIMLGDFNLRSTNLSQLKNLSLCGSDVEVLSFDFRQEEEKRGKEARDEVIISLCRSFGADWVLFSKCHEVGLRVMQECNKMAKTCLWHMDPITNYHEEERQKTREATLSCFNIVETFECAKQYSSNVHLLQEGFDSHCNFFIPGSLYTHDVSFIGSLRLDRDEYQKAIGFVVLTDAYREGHSHAVCQTKINLNFTQGGASDRVYKVLASKGFLLTQPWPRMEDDFEVGKDLDVFSSIEELKEKIAHYLVHFDEAQAIAAHGHQTVQKFNRFNWALRLLKLMEAS